MKNLFAIFMQFFVILWVIDFPIISIFEWRRERNKETPIVREPSGKTVNKEVGKHSHWIAYTIRIWFEPVLRRILCLPPHLYLGISDFICTHIIYGRNGWMPERKLLPPPPPLSLSILAFSLPLNFSIHLLLLCVVLWLCLIDRTKSCFDCCPGIYWLLMCYRQTLSELSE